MISTLTGIQTGPRQLELPPNMPLVDSAGSYPTVYSWPCTSKTYGWSRCQRDSERMPWGDEELVLVEHRARTRRSLSSLTTDSSARRWPGLRRVVRGRRAGRRCVRTRGTARHRSGTLSIDAGSNVVVAHSGSSPTIERTLSLGGAAVGQAQHVVEEAVLLVPHLVPRSPHRAAIWRSARRTCRRCPRSRSCSASSSAISSMFWQYIAIHAVPSACSSRAAGRQRRAAVEDADVVEAEEAALEDVVAPRVLAVDPPGEVQQQLVEDALEELVGRPRRRRALLDLVDAKSAAQACTGGLTSPKFHS
jgi:hypothetical protein